jgi:hypothetical protein
MQHHRACIGGHGTGGGGTLSPPLGTTTHRYIFPYSHFGHICAFIAIWVLKNGGVSSRSVLGESLRCCGSHQAQWLGSSYEKHDTVLNIYSGVVGDM